MENEQGVQETPRRGIWNFSSYEKYLLFFAMTFSNMLQSRILNKHSLFKHLSYHTSALFLLLIWWTFMNLWSYLVCFTCRPTHSYWLRFRKPKVSGKPLGTDPSIQPGIGNPFITRWSITSSNSYSIQSTGELHFQQENIMNCWIMRFVQKIV